MSQNKVVCAVDAQATNLSSLLNNTRLVATILAPTNDAFSTILSQYGISTQQALSQPSLLKGVRTKPKPALIESDILPCCPAARNAGHSQVALLL